jgi:hypothetical protein
MSKLNQQSQSPPGPAGNVIRFPLPAPRPAPEADPGPKIYTQRDLDAARLQGGREAIPAVWGAIRAELAAVGTYLPEMRPGLEAVPDAGERELEAGA